MDRIETILEEYEPVSEPNLRAIPIRTEEGKRIREAFLNKVDDTLAPIDFAQIELRVLALEESKRG
jgi:DNA polymerase I-like protein with 3'-5' exonuclease and polymerase domains